MLTQQQILDVLSQIEHGPKIKTDATKDFEVIANAILNAPASVSYKYQVLNGENNLIVMLPGRVFNMTAILKSKPDFEHLECQNSELVIPGNPHGLTQSEVDTLKQYTSIYFIPVNGFLRSHGGDAIYAEKINAIINVIANLSSALKKINLPKEKLSKDELPAILPSVNRVFRREVNQDQDSDAMVDQRIYAATSRSINEKLLIADGFLSASVSEGVFTSYPLLTHYYMLSPYPLISNVSSYSSVPTEEEYLFLPNTQAIFVKAIPGNNAGYEFSAVIVRTPMLVDTKAYQSGTASLQVELDCLRAILPEVHTQMSLLFLEPTFIDLIKYQKLAQDIIKHGDYVYQHYLSKPYKDGHDFYRSTEGIVERPNHGLAHALRTSIFIPMVVKYFARHAKNSYFKDYCEAALDNDLLLAKIQVGMLFWAIGRESEISNQTDLQRYKSYRKQSYEYFCDYAKRLGWSEANLLLFVGMEDVEFHSTTGEDEKGAAQYIFDIIVMAHNLDLMRCYTSKMMDACFSSLNALLVEPSASQQDDFNTLLNAAYQCLISTGDKAMSKPISGSFEDGGLVVYRQPFYQANTNAQVCLHMCLPYLLGGYMALDLNKAELKALSIGPENEYPLLSLALLAVSGLAPLAESSHARVITGGGASFGGIVMTPYEAKNIKNLLSLNDNKDLMHDINKAILSESNINLIDSLMSHASINKFDIDLVIKDFDESIILPYTEKMPDVFFEKSYKAYEIDNLNLLLFSHSLHANTDLILNKMDNEYIKILLKSDQEQHLQTKYIASLFKSKPIEPSVIATTSQIDDGNDEDLDQDQAAGNKKQLD